MGDMPRILNRYMLILFVVSVKFSSAYRFDGIEKTVFIVGSALF